MIAWFPATVANTLGLAQSITSMYRILEAMCGGTSEVVPPCSVRYSMAELSKHYAYNFYTYKLFISIVSIQSYNNWLSRSLYIPQLISTSEITTYTSMVYCLNQRHNTTQSYYTDIEPTSPYPTLIITSARLGSDKYKFVKLFV